MSNKDNEQMERFPALKFTILEEIDQAIGDSLWLTEIRTLLQEMALTCEELIEECNDSEPHN